MLALLEANVGKARRKIDRCTPERINGDARGRMRRQRPVIDPVLRRSRLAQQPVVNNGRDVGPVRTMDAIFAHKSYVRTVRGIDVPAVEKCDELTVRTE